MTYGKDRIVFKMKNKRYKYSILKNNKLVSSSVSTDKRPLENEIAHVGNHRQCVACSLDVRYMFVICALHGSSR